MRIPARPDKKESDASVGMALDILVILLGAVWLVSAASLDINIQKMLWLCGGSLVLIGVLSCCRFPWLRIPEAVILFLFALYQVLNLAVSLSGRHAECPYAICVPGAQVRGNRISQTFTERLDLAFENYHKYKCRPYLIICGAVGSEDSVSEAEAGANYLTAKGTPCNRIMQEARSFNTMDSFMNVYSMLPEKSAPILITTSSWGVLRALWLAGRAGLNAKATGCRSDFLWYMSYSLREMLAIVYNLFRS